jgi:uncharacterized protein YidB (DUF937 family)
MSQLDDLLGSLMGGGGQGSSGGLGGGLTGQGGGGGGMMGALLPVLGGLLASGGLSKILSGFQAQGAGAEAESWVGTGPNEPVDAAKVEEVVGADQISQIAEQLGISESEAADAVAEALPQVVDKVSPDGKLPPQEELDGVFERLAASAAR